MRETYANILWCNCQLRNENDRRDRTEKMWKCLDVKNRGEKVATGTPVFLVLMTSWDACRETRNCGFDLLFHSVYHSRVSHNQCLYVCLITFLSPIVFVAQPRRGYDGSLRRWWSGFAQKWWSMPSEISSAPFCISSTRHWVNRMSNDALSIRISHKAQQKGDSGCCPTHLTRLVRRSVPRGEHSKF